MGCMGCIGSYLQSPWTSCMWKMINLMLSHYKPPRESLFWPKLFWWQAKKGQLSRIMNEKFVLHQQKINNDIKFIKGRMKNLSARYRLQLVDRGLLGCEGVDECLPCIYKKKWHIEKKTSMQYKSNNGINVIFSMSVSFIYYKCLYFFFFEKTVEVLTKYYLLEHTMVCTLNWDAGDYTKPKQLIEQINLCQYL